MYTVQAKLYDDTNQRMLFVSERRGLDAAERGNGGRQGPEIVAALCVLSASTSDGATAFYCKAGKDRTGLVAALALHCRGASDDAIVADYTRARSGKVALGGGKVEGTDGTDILDSTARPRRPARHAELHQTRVRVRGGIPGPRGVRRGREADVG